MAPPTPNNSANGERRKTRIVILGGGFGGVSTAAYLERLCRSRLDVEIILVSQDNFIVLTPLLFEVCSGTLDPRHCSMPIRAYLRTTRFVEAVVRGIDLDRRVVLLGDGNDRSELSYDQLVLALGARTNRAMIPARSTPSRSKPSPTPCCSAIMSSSGLSALMSRMILTANAAASASSSSAADWLELSCSAN